MPLLSELLLVEVELPVLVAPVAPVLAAPVAPVLAAPVAPALAAGAMLLVLLVPDVPLDELLLVALAAQDGLLAALVPLVPLVPVVAPVEVAGLGDVLETPLTLDGAEAATPVLGAVLAPAGPVLVPGAAWLALPPHAANTSEAAASVGMRGFNVMYSSVAWQRQA